MGLTMEHLGNDSGMRRFSFLFGCCDEGDIQVRSCKSNITWVKVFVAAIVNTAANAVAKTHDRHEQPFDQKDQTLERSVKGTTCCITVQNSRHAQGQVAGSPVQKQQPLPHHQ